MLVKPTIEAVYYIATHMRPIDRLEVFALRWSSSEAALAAAVMERGPLSWIATAADGEPVYACGIVPDRPGCWSLWGFSTERWPEVVRQVSRKILREFPVLHEHWHRIDVMTLAEKIEGHAWLRRLGAVETADLPGYGRNGEDYKLFTWR